MILRTLGLALVLLASGCGDKAKSKGASGIAGARAAWEKAGLAPAGFAKVDGAAYAGGRCEGGKVAGLDTVVCEYDDAAAVSRGVQAAYATLGSETAAVVPVGTTVLVVADRAGVDAEGKKLNQVANAFRGTSVAAR